ncbi:MAG: AAA family ATPase [Betaproteobacteria bacterium]
MLTKVVLRNFKRFDNADVELGKSVVLIGPNNSGKTTALQALALWEIGVRRWFEKRQPDGSSEKKKGVTINRKDLVSIPVPTADLLWNDIHVRDVSRKSGKQETRNIRIEIEVSGITDGSPWSCGLEFDYANEESFYCRPLRSDEDGGRRMEVPIEAESVRVAFLPPMSGLADREFVKQQGEIGFLIGQGQTAQVLRNLCYQIYASSSGSPHDPSWDDLSNHVKKLFGVEIQPPSLVEQRSELIMRYREPSGVQLDISSSGRGLQQTLLLLTHLYANPKTVLLLDEPDAHLEILRQREIYRLLTDVAEQKGSQVIAASHSEVILNEAAGRGTVVAFVGKPHRLNDRGSQLTKALSDIGWEQYYQAEQTGWALYLEDSTDLAILQAFAKRLGHAASGLLNGPFVSYVAANLPSKARDNFYGLREAKQDLVGIAIFDRLEKELQERTPLRELMWSRREIENYFCTEATLLAYADHDVPDDLFGAVEKERRTVAMREAIAEISNALSLIRAGANPWSPDIKATDEFLDPVFRRFFEKLGLPITFRKSDYFFLASLVPQHEIDVEISRKLDAIVATANQAKPRR